MSAEVYIAIVHIMLLLSIVYFFIVSLSTGKRNVYFLLMCSVVIITDLGFASLVSTQDLDKAILCTKLTYVGGCFIPLFATKVGLKICGIDLKKWTYNVMTAFSAIIFCLVCTIGYSDLYYSDQYLDTSNGFSILRKEYGPLHNFYYAYLGCYLAFAVGCFIMAFFKKKHFSAKTLIPYAFIWLAADFTYFVEKLFHIPYYLEPIGITLALTFFVIVFKRVNLFDINTTLVNVYDRVRDNGYVIFDHKYRYTACNSKARDIFKEFATINVDSYADDIKDTEFYKKVFEPIIVSKTGTTIDIEHNDFYIAVSMTPIGGDDFSGSKGFLFELKDESEQHRYEQLVISYQQRLEEEAFRKTQEIEEIRNSIVMGIAGMVEARDQSTGDHIRRTSDVVRIFARKLIETAYPIDRIILYDVMISAPMHDLGKIAVDDEILRKAGKFTDEEYAIMKTHAPKGAGIVRRVLSGTDDQNLVRVAVNVARYHHEKWNGKGYPDGLSGEEIPVEARIMALADVFDALVSKRVYKQAYSYDEAFKIIEDSIGEHFDPYLGMVFLQCRDELIRLYDQYQEETGGNA